MNQSTQIFIGDTVQKQVRAGNQRGICRPCLASTFYKIENYDGMAPFFMSIVSSSNHWLFISSTGGLSAGRVSAEQSLFPYYTEDKLTENSENTGNKSILLVTRGRADKFVGTVFRTLQRQLSDRAEYLQECTSAPRLSLKRATTAWD